MNAEKRLLEIIKSLYAFEGETAADTLAEDALAFMNGKKDQLSQDIMIRIVKGGTYKIKGYYLENNKLSDIRGASAIITAVQEKILPQLLIAKIGFDCIVYNGGGNLLALVPASTDEDIGNILEREARKFLVTASTAFFVSEAFPLSEILGTDYRNNIAARENELDNRKKAKIDFDISPRSELVGTDTRLLGSLVEAEQAEKTYCEKCKKRISIYSRNGQRLCGGCLHKSIAGETQRSIYYDEYESRTGAHVEHIKSFTEIDTEHIALLYADGNNMGGIIQKFQRITQMIEFSSFVKETMSALVYDSIAKRGITRFEIVALGGDDIFIIVPGKQAVQLAALLIKEYNRTFSEKFPDTDSTLSVGICIAKPNTPIKVMLESAENELSAAKALVKDENCNGSLSFRIFDTYEGTSSDRKGRTLLPYSLETANTLLQYVSDINGSTVQTKLRNLSEGFKDSDSSAEASLFYKYVNAKSKEHIDLPDITGYKCEGGYYIKGNERAYLWEDLLDLLNYSN